MIQTQFSGIINTASARDTPETAVSDAVNVDITDAKGLVARLGRQTKLTTAVIDTAYTTQDGTCYVVSAGHLHRVDPSGALVQLAPSSATRFCDYEGHLFSNDGLMVFHDQVQSLVVPPPRTPNVVLTGGNRSAGLYTIVCTSRNKDGRESGTSYPVTVELSSPGDILVQPLGNDAATQEIYMTDVNSTVFFNTRSGQRISPSLVNSATFDAYSASSVAFYDSSLFYAVRLGDYSAVFFSDPFQYHLFGTDSSYFVVPGLIDCMVGTLDGIVIGTGEAIYVYTRDGLSKVSSYGVVPGQSVVKSPTGKVYAYTPYGMCSLFPFEELTLREVSLPSGSVCRTMYVLHGGAPRIIAVHDGYGNAANRFN